MTSYLIEMRLKTYKMAMSILPKFLNLKWNILRTIWHIEVGDGSFFFAFFTLFHLSLTFFRPEVPFNFMSPQHCVYLTLTLLVPRIEHHLSSFKCGFLNMFSRQNLLRSLPRLLFLLRWNKYGAKKCLKTTFHSTFEMIQL